MHGYIAIAVFLPLLAGLLLGPCSGLLGKRVGWVAFWFPLISFAMVLVAGVQAGPTPHVLVEWPWIPSLGINLTFLVDGLSLLFAGIVSGVGVLVFFYANQYFKGDESRYPLGRFYSYLLLFMSAMLGTVLSDNLMLLFIFWELTGITSFLLIGFLHEKDGSRAGARMALLVTMLTSLCMLVGIVILHQLTGTLSISELMAMDLPVPLDGTLINVVLVLILLGAFGKSAQFPFQFWLPNAMAAPTPVSAYLHSATMVKLGVFLVARIYPIFLEVELWVPVLTLVGFGTMLVASFLALRSNVLKAILAYSTVTQLGDLIGLYGLESQLGVFSDYYHILDHVFYKACLFMVVGIITHCTGCKDLRDLGGLRHSMPLLAIASGIACASMAGLPLTMGFVAKEMLLADFAILLREGPWTAWAAFVFLVLASIMKIAFSCRLFYYLFFRPVPQQVQKHLHIPSIRFQLPPLILAGCSLVFGWVLALPEALLHYLHVDGLQTREGHLAMWHGVNIELAISLAIISAGLSLFLYGRGTHWRWTEIPRFLRFDDFFERGLLQFNAFTKFITKMLRSESPADYLPVMVTLMVLAFGGYLMNAVELKAGAAFIMEDWEFQANTLRVFVATLIGLSTLGVVLLSRWTSQLIMLSVAGFLITFYFVLYRAPDLALTQILVESATLILVLLLLARFPKSAQQGEDRELLHGMRNLMNLVISLGLGAVVTCMILVAGAKAPPTRLGDAFLAQTVRQAEGSNAVNTILVDFRGFDTMGEIAVLVIAVLGSIGLFFRYKRSDQQREQRALGAPGFGIFQQHPGERRER
ncbi:MAG: hydrogen gas-evolving membrane-bound hydrogenase subunit E [Verrucomicrobiota bacterium]